MKLIYLLLTLFVVLYGCTPAPTPTANEMGKIIMIPAASQPIFKKLEKKGFGFVKFEDFFIKNQVGLKAGQKPIVVFTGMWEGCGFVFSTEAGACLTLPAYHVDYVPGNFLVYSGNNPDELLKAVSCADYFVSDGRSEVIFVPESQKTEIKTYALISGLRVSIAGQLPKSYLTKKQVHDNIKTSGDGLYVTYPVATTRDFLNSVLTGAKQSKLDTLVIDFKESYAKYFIENGVCSIESMEQTKPARVFKQLVNDLHKQGFFCVARIVVFKDFGLANLRPDLTIKRKSTGKVWLDRSGAPWMDHFSSEVRKYNVDLAELAICCGFDEVQFDYIRFPTEGDMTDLSFAYQKLGQKREDAIARFLNEVSARLLPYKKSIAIDIFGVALWDKSKDRINLGQNIERLAEYVDVICPMLYPSHFHPGYDGYAWPGDEPYYFNYTGCKKLFDLLQKCSHPEVKVVPWLQAFDWRVRKGFTPDYVLAEIKAARDAGAGGYLLWNAGNKYGVSFKALVGNK